MRRKQSDEHDPADSFYVGQDRLKAADILWAQAGLSLAGIELMQEAAERQIGELVKLIQESVPQFFPCANAAP